jgi:oxygen-independent coproporphyrinogen-3 oxidase
MGMNVELLQGSPYQDYLYAYPHKTAYRRLDPPRPLERAWEGEARTALFAYLHVPFCQLRCGFCNLFTASRPEGDLVEAWLSALEREIRQVAAALGPARYARVALGGGTPTFLEPAQLERALDLLEGTLGADLSGVPVGVEVSPETATPARLALLRARGVDRVSIGVQSFEDAETRAVLRPQRATAVEVALDRIRAQGFPVLNLDLIYGIDGQTPASWEASLRRALRWSPEEIYLYPLYVRPLTGLSACDRRWDDQRLALYRLGRDLLRAAGYRQVSMRMFRRQDALDLAGPIYRCQEDGMVGLGCGARSYTRRLHYSTEYAVAAGGVREIIAAYARKSDAELAVADWGFPLDEAEQRRRWLILSLLADGVSRGEWRARFGDALEQDAPALATLVAAGLARDDGEWIRLTDAGVERSDAVGPWLVTPAVRARMDAWELR